MVLKLSRDRKVTPKAKLNSGQWTPEIPNAFGLPAHISCPGKTTVCENICYAFKLERAYTNVNKLLKNNWDTLKACGDNVSDMEALLDELLNSYVSEHERVERLRKTTYRKVFRIHWDGDFYSVPYAKAWAKAIKKRPDIQFWAYTRSFKPPVNVVPYLKGIDNLSLYLSVDDVNQRAAKTIIKRYDDVKVAMLGDTFGNALVKVEELTEHKAPKCPEQTGRYPLVTDKQQGACVECTLCIDGNNNVLFSISKK